MILQDISDSLVGGWTTHRHFKNGINRQIVGNFLPNWRGEHSRKKTWNHHLRSVSISPKKEKTSSSNPSPTPTPFNTLYKPPSTFTSGIINKVTGSCRSRNSNAGCSAGGCKPQSFPPESPIEVGRSCPSSMILWWSQRGGGGLVGLAFFFGWGGWLETLLGEFTRWFKPGRRLNMVKQNTNLLSIKVVFSYFLGV